MSQTSGVPGTSQRNRNDLSDLVRAVTMRKCLERFDEVEIVDETNGLNWT